MTELMIDHASVVITGRQVLRDIQLRCENGITMCTGTGGSGKTTLCRLACGLIKPTEGTVRIGGTVLPVSRSAAVPKELTLRRALQMQKRLSGNTGSVQPLAEIFELTQLLGAHWQQLTELQKASAALLLAFAAGPDRLICDDLTRDLTETDRSRLLSALKQAADESKTAILWISGTERDAEGISDLYRLEDGYLKRVKK